MDIALAYFTGLLAACGVIAALVVCIVLAICVGMVTLAGVFWLVGALFMPIRWMLYGWPEPAVEPDLARRVQALRPRD